MNDCTIGARPVQCFGNFSARRGLVVFRLHISYFQCRESLTSVADRQCRGCSESRSRFRISSYAKEQAARL